MLHWVIVWLCIRCTATHTDTSSDLRSQPLSLAILTSPTTNTNPSTLSSNKTITPDDIYNMQQVTWVQAPPSVHIPHTNDNRQITGSMHPQAPILRVPIAIPRDKPISVPLVATTTKPSSKPTTLAANSSKRKRHHKWQGTQLRNATTPTSPTTCIRT